MNEWNILTKKTTKNLESEQLTHGRVEAKPWEGWLHAFNHCTIEVQWLGPRVDTCDVLRGTAYCYANIPLTDIPLSFGVLQTVHLQETMAATHFPAYWGRASELQAGQRHQAAHGASFPSHHLDSLSKKIQRKQKTANSCFSEETLIVIHLSIYSQTVSQARIR